MEVVSEYATLGLDKLEEWLESLAVLVTEQFTTRDTPLTVLSHDSRYNMSILAEWFHLIPHVDIHLRPLPANVTFEPSDNEYLESLGILVALPGFWLILTLLFFLIFFLCRCCDGSGSASEQQKQLNQHQAGVGKTLKPKSLTGCKLCLVLITIITAFVITVSILGTIVAHRGMIKVRNYTDDVAAVLETVQNDTRTVVNTLRDHIDADIEDLNNAVDRSLVRDSDAKANFVGLFFNLKKNVTKCKKRVEEIYTRVSRLNLRPIPDTIDSVERVRWLSTFLFVIFLFVICLILFCGLARNSRCTLIMFSVCGLLALVVGFVLTSLYFGFIVASSDFCSDPEVFLADRLSSSVELALFDYYVRCASPNPFFRHISDSKTTLEGSLNAVRNIEMFCLSHCQSEQRNIDPKIKTVVEHLKMAETIMVSVSDLVDCSRIHEDYRYTMSATCKDLIEGVFLLLVTSAAIGFLFSILVLCSSHTWIHLRPLKSTPNANNSASHSNASGLLSTLETDESEPFLSSTPHHATMHHPTMFSNNSLSSSITNTSMGNKRFRDSYMSAYGTTGRGRFSHTPPQTPHFTTLGGAVSSSNVLSNTAANRSGRSEEQLAFLSPPPAYDQLSQQQQLHYQQQQQQQHQQMQHQHHQIYGSHVQAPHHTSTLPHHHHMQQQHQHQQQQMQHQHHQMQPHMHHQQQQQQQQQPQAHQVGGTLSHQQSGIGHYVYPTYGHSTFMS